MKKILSILLSIAMLVTMVSMVAISANAEVQSEVIYDMSEGSRPSDYTVTQKGAEYISFVDSEEEGYGDVLKALRTGNKGSSQDQAFCIKLPTNIWTSHDIPETLSFEAKTNTGKINFSNFVYLSSSATSATTNGYASISNFDSTWKTYTIDLTTQKATAAIDNGYLYLCLRNAWSSSDNTCDYFYIDNIKLNYEQYPEQRLNQAAPAAPTVASATGNTVTLAPNSNCQFSMNGTNWQSSNVFTGLTENTQYSFYARYKETMEYYASPASEATVFTTPVVYKWNLYSSDFTLSNNTTTANFNTTNASEGTYFEGTGLSADTHATFTSKVTVPAGVYSATLYARKAGSRASINVDVNGTRVATELNTGLNGGTQNLNQSFPMTENTITITEESTITMTITTTTSGSLYLNALQLEKIGDYVAPVVDPYENIAGTTSVTAQLRIGNVNGIRFITNVNADKVAAAETAGYTVTFGTLIAPVDLVEGELSFESSDYIDVVSGGYFKYNSGVVAGSIVGIKTDNVARDFIARGYVKLTKDETTTVYYATQPNEGRSLKTVAAACVADSSFFNMLNDAQKEQVTTWATWANA